MKRWSWYVGWLLGWFALWSIVFVPVSKLFPDVGAAIGGPMGAGIGGGIQGLILISGWVVLYYGFRFINRRLRTREQDPTDPRGISNAVAGSGMSERETALLATVRDEPRSALSAAQGDMVATGPRPAPDVAVTQLRTATAAVPATNIQNAPSGVMKSAGNPLVRKAFATAMEEVSTKTYDQGLWAMSLVECNGDERAAGLAYMKARAAEIAWADAKAAESVQMAVRQKDAELNQPRAAEHREVKRNEPRTEMEKLATLSNLFLAVRRNRLDEVNRIVGTYPESIETKDSYGRPPLHIAVEECNLPMVKALLKLGADPRVTNSYGANALDIAKREGTPKIVSELQKYLGRV